MKSRQQEIVQTLAESVPVLSLTQIARTWWTLTRWGKSRAKQSLQTLVTTGWLHQQEVLARPVPQLNYPLFNWSPSKRKPDFHSLSRKLHRRAQHAAQLTTIVCATQQAASLFGTGPRASIKLGQMTHDLSVGEIFLHYRNAGLPSKCWKSEQRLSLNWPVNVLPDGLICDEHGQVKRAIEYGGDYPRSRLQELHAGFSNMNLAYELW